MQDINNWSRLRTRCSSRKKKNVGDVSSAVSSDEENVIDYSSDEVEDDVQDNEQSRKLAEQKAIWSSPGITYTLIIKILCVYNKLN